MNKICRVSPHWMFSSAVPKLLTYLVKLTILRISIILTMTPKKYPDLYILGNSADSLLSTIYPFFGILGTTGLVGPRPGHLMLIFCWFQQKRKKRVQLQTFFC